MTGIEYPLIRGELPEQDLQFEITQVHEDLFRIRSRTMSTGEEHVVEYTRKDIIPKLEQTLKRKFDSKEFPNYDQCVRDKMMEIQLFHKIVEKQDARVELTQRAHDEFRLAHLTHSQNRLDGETLLTRKEAEKFVRENLGKPFTVQTFPILDMCDQR